MSNKSELGKAHAAHHRDVKRLRAKCDKYRICNELRKMQIAAFQLVFKKLISEGKLTREELKQMTLNKKEAYAKYLANDKQP
jgi:hypothetical protein